MNTIKNQIQLIGHLGADPEVRQFEGGKTKASFTMATSDSYVNQKGEKIQNTQWHNIIVWGPQTKIVENYLKKGSEVAIQGKLTYRNYDDKEGNKKYLTEIILSEILLMEKKSN
ncbi:MAG: single-stranded DNA-binding protein [Bacteroidetes bacterium]|jgi:single-strand DNA-binding protein|nr:single-stranded DNA-binding protein [Bacteroidota bacterium]MBK7639922.1 single-stranded DNA-binding protein [Bacteroidota bacterium]MBK8671736.1 single-stranded DNA-binding protein [Bacteroidota bacterium]MBK9353284.1 single-stranded DNA-binding protein [Bacteroidota bacterium]MBK9635023.1 single-stranded DNA-binding protein [Bacteroidota bacterium]